MLLLVAMAALAGEDAAAVPDPHAAFAVVHVVDEWGKPIPEADLQVTRFAPRAPGSGWGVGAGTTRSYHCDAAGQCQVEVPPATSDGGISAKKAGYYESWGGRAVQVISEHLVPGPGNPPITLTLMKRLDPVPMVAREVAHLAVPVLDVPLGFDLERGSWVAPQGQGAVADLVITVQKHVESPAEFAVTVAMTFSAADDGIMAYLPDTDPAQRTTTLVLPRLAPPEGYLPTWTKRAGRHDGMWTGHRHEAGFLFRVRTQRTADAITAARYGCIVGDVGIDPGESGEANGVQLSFTYLLNPDPHSRSLEWDGTNLVPEGDPQWIKGPWR